MNVTVASYNIHKAEGLDRRVDLARIARVLGEIDADIVGIQEIYRPQAEALAAELGMSMEMGVTRHFENMPYGNAIVTRFKVHGPRIRRTHPAPLPIFPLDRIYWDRELHADSYRVHRSQLARIASDHLPVVARLRLAPVPSLR